MDMDKLDEACERLAEACEAFRISLQEAIQAFSEMFSNAIRETMNKLENFLGYLRKEKKKAKKPNGIPPVKYHHKKDYLHNQSISAYKVDKKAQKNLPYQRRNY